MAVVLTEKATSRKVRFGTSSGTETLLYSASGSADETEVYAAVIAGTSATFNGLVRQAVTLDPLGDDDRWDVEVEYGTIGLPEHDAGADMGETPSTAPLGAGYTFDISAETVHITQAEKSFGPVIARREGPSGNDMSAGIDAYRVISPKLAAIPGVVGKTVRLYGTATDWIPGDYQVVAVDVPNDEVLFANASHHPGAAAGERWALLADWEDERSGIGMVQVAPGVVLPVDVLAAETDAGKTVWITAGPPGWRLGPYKIVAASPLVGWVLDRQPALVGAAGGASWTIVAGPLPEQAAKFDFKGAIGVNKDAIAGCDVFRSKFEWTRTVKVAGVSRAYMLAVRNLVGKKNASWFYGSAPGDVLFLGASASFSVSDAWSVTHRFAEIEGRANIEIAPGLVVPYKRGWDYLWVRYEDRPQAGSVAPRATAAYVEEVYPDGDFSILGIGT